MLKDGRVSALGPPDNLMSAGSELSILLDEIGNDDGDGDNDGGKGSDEAKGDNSLQMDEEQKQQDEEEEKPMVTMPMEGEHAMMEGVSTVDYLHMYTFSRSRYRYCIYTILQ